MFKFRRKKRERINGSCEEHALLAFSAYISTSFTLMVPIKTALQSSLCRDACVFESTFSICISIIGYFKLYIHMYDCRHSSLVISLTAVHYTHTQIYFYSNKQTWNFRIELKKKQRKKKRSRIKCTHTNLNKA